MYGKERRRVSHAAACGRRRSVIRGGMGDLTHARNRRPKPAANQTKPKTAQDTKLELFRKTFMLGIRVDGTGLATHAPPQDPECKEQWGRDGRRNNVVRGSVQSGLLFPLLHGDQPLYDAPPRWVMPSTTRLGPGKAPSHVDCLPSRPSGQRPSSSRAWG